GHRLPLHSICRYVLLRCAGGNREGLGQIAERPTRRFGYGRHVHDWHHYGHALSIVAVNDDHAILLPDGGRLPVDADSKPVIAASISGGLVQFDPAFLRLGCKLDSFGAATEYVDPAVLISERIDIRKRHRSRAARPR